jgi:hypothetical protein
MNEAEIERTFEHKKGELERRQQRQDELDRQDAELRRVHNDAIRIARAEAAEGRASSTTLIVLAHKDERDRQAAERARAASIAAWERDWG